MCLCVAQQEGKVPFLNLFYYNLLKLCIVPDSISGIPYGSSAMMSEYRARSYP